MDPKSLTNDDNLKKLISDFLKDNQQKIGIAQQKQNSELINNFIIFCKINLNEIAKQTETKEELSFLIDALMIAFFESYIEFKIDLLREMLHSFKGEIIAKNSLGGKNVQ